MYLFQNISEKHKHFINSLFGDILHGQVDSVVVRLVTCIQQVNHYKGLFLSKKNQAMILICINFDLANF